MSIRRLTLTTLVALFAVSGGLSTIATPASALLGHGYLSSFPFSGEASHMAVDESTGDVYVLDATVGSVYKFNSAGEPAEFTALHANVLPGFSAGRAVREQQLAVDNSSGPAKGDLYVADSLSVYIFGSNGSSLGMLPGSCGVAVDPAGNTYTASDEVVAKYHPEKNPTTPSDFVASLTGNGLRQSCNLTVDGEGGTYVMEYGEAGISKFDVLQFGLPEQIGLPIAKKVVAATVDPATNHLLAITKEGGGIVEYGSGGEQLGEPFASESISRQQLENGESMVGLAADGAHSRIFVDNNDTHEVDVYSGLTALPDIGVAAPSNVAETSVTVNGTINPQGIDATCTVEYGTTTSYGLTVACAPADVGAGNAPVSVAAGLSGLAPATLYHYRFVTTSVNGKERGRDQTLASASKPAVDGEAVLSVTLTGATVRAEINPHYWETTYQFEYGTDTAYGASAPVPAARAGATNTDQDAVWTLTGLRPGTTYHFRVAATDRFGTVYGQDLAFTTYPAPTAGSGSCVNATIRQQQASSYLPDCRAYEMVSPPEKNGTNIAADPTLTQSSIDGEAIKYFSTASFGGAQGSEYPGAEYVGQREANGWSSHAINPEQRGVPNELLAGPSYEALSGDLSKGVFFALSPVLSGKPNVEQVANLYLRDDVLTAGAGSYELLSNSVSPLPPRTPQATDKGVAFAGASADFSHVVFEEAGDLTPEATGLNTNLPKLYEWHDGAERLVGILPDGKPAEGSVAGKGAGGGPVRNPSSDEMTRRNWTRHVISADGSRVVFVGPPFTGGNLDPVLGNLYMRIDGTRTVQLNVSERLAADGFQPAEFQDATPDDSKVFFTTTQLLTDDATGEHVRNLYMYNVNAPAGHHLTLISKDESPSGGTGDPAGEVVGVSDDGSYVYFLNNGDVLVPGQREFPERQMHLLYVWHDGLLRAVVQHKNEGDGNEPYWGNAGAGGPVGAKSAFRMTPDGRQIAFVSSVPSTAERAGVRSESTGNECFQCEEVFVYNYDTDRVTCASCSPTGTPLAGSAGFEEFSSGGIGVSTQYLSRPLSSDARYVFFDTGDALVAQDTNGRRDVYEYDTSTGAVHLISGGTCNCDSLFVDASADGSNVFFTTNQRLVRVDTDSNADIYDARIEGGIASQSRPVALPCAGDACQNPGEMAPGFSEPASATFSGAGNVSGAASKAVSAKSKRAGAKKHRKKHRKKREKKNANRSVKRSPRRAGH